MQPTKDRPRLGVLASDANPPHYLELSAMIQAAAEFAIDRVLYAVTDGGNDGLLAATKAHRFAMAELAVKIFDPVITVARFGDLHDLPVATTVMANGQPRRRTDLEDDAFRLFSIHPRDELTLVYLTTRAHYRRVDDSGRDDTINKLLANLKYGLYGFDPDRHNVMAVFIGEQPESPVDITFDLHERALMKRGVFTIEHLQSTTLPGRPADLQEFSAALLDALLGPPSSMWALMPHVVYTYIEDHPEYKQQLAQSRSTG
jgi:hypothetical protein